MQIGSSVRRTLKEAASTITFVETDRQVSFSHNRPLYVPFEINGIEFQRGFIDCGASLNLISLKVLKVTGYLGEDLIQQPITITRFGRTSQWSLGYITLGLVVGPIRCHTCFNMIDADTSYHTLLGRCWMHRFAMTYSDVFTWTYEEIPGLDPAITCQKLNISAAAILIKQS